MAWPFDPWNLRRGVEARDVRAPWPDLWTDATKWWTEPAAVTPEAVADLNERLVTELAEGVARRFEGREITVPVAGRPGRALVVWIRLRRSDELPEGRLDLRDATWEDWSFETLSVTARTVRIESWPDARVVLAGLEVTGRTALAPLLARLDARVPEWRLGLDDAGRVEARRPDLSLALTLEPVVANRVLELELRGVRWRRVRLVPPAWLRLTRTHALPSLSRGIAILEARRAGDAVEFRATVPSIEERIDLARVRDAISGASGLGPP